LLQYQGKVSIREAIFFKFYRPKYGVWHHTYIIKSTFHATIRSI
jgi:hypothetical protein